MSTFRRLIKAAKRAQKGPDFLGGGGGSKYSQFLTRCCDWKLMLKRRISDGLKPGSSDSYTKISPFYTGIKATDIKPTLKFLPALMFLN